MKIIVLALIFSLGVVIGNLSRFDGIASSGYACGYAEAIEWAAYGKVEEETTRICANYRQAAKKRGWFDDTGAKP